MGGGCSGAQLTSIEPACVRYSYSKYDARCSLAAQLELQEVVITGMRRSYKPVYITCMLPTRARPGEGAFVVNVTLNSHP